MKLIVMKDNHNISNPGAAHVPPQEIGSKMDAVEKIELESESEAIHFFQTVKDRLLDVNRWAEFAGGASSNFYLTDRNGVLVHRMATDGDRIKIDIPGPGTKTGNGFDWVTIDEIRSQIIDGAEVLSMIARPSDNPLNSSMDTAHFLSDKATSTFQVKRVGRIIYAEEHGRNEVPNTETDHALDNVRNTLVGWGAKIGFSYPQWKALVNGLLNHENPYQPS
ncbi:hypothetical protein QG516_03305 [Pedobacter gandavensis]|uniref:hypothetical protein n=1 Tax=Pedobacter gandavensis TaxID=2679963 RepID=UPI002478469F|nr:hypothetical protein [Pedobacter gandavensis]WGQ10681.1 hypothetical protein QG516_03305 [Pedobacter gandavensis]